MECLPYLDFVVTSAFIVNGYSLILAHGKKI
jgi:hypothetical protein